MVQALAGSVFVADCTVEGLLHAAELPRILSGGARVLVICNEHPEILERCLPRAEDEAAVRDAMRRLKARSEMHVTSAAGTDLRIALAGARVGGVWGFTASPARSRTGPAGWCWPSRRRAASTARWCCDRGDVNLTFKRYLARPGAPDDRRRLCRSRSRASSVDAELMRGYFAAWGDAGPTRCRMSAGA